MNLTNKLTTSEVADLLGVASSTVLRMVAEEKLPAGKVCGMWVFDSKHIEEFAKTYTKTPSGQYDRTTSKPNKPMHSDKWIKRDVIAPSAWDTLIEKMAAIVANNTSARLEELDPHGIDR